MRNVLVLLSVCSLFATCLPGSRGTCRGHECDEQHQAAKAHGLLGTTLRANPSAVTPRECRDSKTYPVDSKLKTQELPTPVVNVRWAGKGADVDKYVFALTRGSDGLVGGSLFRSDYYGKPNSWDDRTNEMTDVLDEDDKKNALVGVVDIHFLPDHPGHMIFQGPGHTHWISEDYGKTYTAVDTPGGTLGYGSEIKIHPTRPDWVLAKVRRNECLKEQTSISKWCAYDVFLSEDFARTWTNLTANSGGRVSSFWDFEWMAALDQKKNDPMPDQTILATVYESASKQKGPYPGWDKDMQFVRSKDFFKTPHTRLVPCGNQFEVLNNQIYLAAPADCPVHPDGSKRKGATGRGSRGRDVILLVSGDEGRSFQEACLPIIWLDKGYNLIATHDGDGAFVVVDHDELDELSARAPISNIYSSGPNSTIFTIGMRRNFRRGYVTDFARVEGLPGMYLANQLDGKVFKDPTLLPPQAAYDDYVQTKITFNGGSNWQEIASPTVFSFPECSKCRPSDTCKLHLHGPSSWHYGAVQPCSTHSAMSGGTTAESFSATFADARPSFYSHKSAPGVVMAVGNTGEYLDLAAESTCTWLSSDGGATWRDILPSAAIYEVGDHGGVVIMALHGTVSPAEEVYFSLNHGECWYTVHLAEAISIQNIRVEPKGESDTFIIHGQACVASDAHPSCTHDPHSKSQPAGRLYTIDITDVMGTDLATCKSTDYHLWSPPDPTTCLLGRNFTMKRRKPEADCFNPYDFNSDTKSEPCECGETDTECEFGYEFVGHECQKIPDMELNSCPLVKAGKYFPSKTHQRLIHDDACVGINKLIPDTNGAGIPNGGLPKGGSHSSVAHFFVFLLVVGIVIVALGVWWSQFAADHTKRQIEDLVGPLLEAVTGFAGGLVAWCREKFSGSGRSRGEASEGYFQPLSGGDGPLDDFDADDARSAPVFGSYR